MPHAIITNKYLNTAHYKHCIQCYLIVVIYFTYHSYTWGRWWLWRLWRHAIPAPLCTAWFRWILQETIISCYTSANLHSVFPADFTGNYDHAWKQYFQPQFHTSYAHNTFNLLSNIVLAVMTCWAKLAVCWREWERREEWEGGHLLSPFSHILNFETMLNLLKCSQMRCIHFLILSTKLPVC